MTPDRSNVHMTSNVYPVATENGRIDFHMNAKFVSHVADKEALRKIIEAKYGRVNDHRQLERYASSIPGIQDWQMRRIAGCDSCSYAEVGDKPWGSRIVNGKYVTVCRCERRQCTYFKECRPEEDQNAGS